MIEGTGVRTSTGGSVMTQVSTARTSPAMPTCLAEATRVGAAAIVPTLTRHPPRCRPAAGHAAYV